MLEERQGLEVGALDSSSVRGIGSREVMRTGSSIPELSKLVKRNALERRSAPPDPLDTIGEDDLEALADGVRLVSSPVSIPSLLHWCKDKPNQYAVLGYQESS